MRWVPAALLPRAGAEQVLVDGWRRVWGDPETQCEPPLDENNVGFSRIPHLPWKRRIDHSEMGHGGRRQGRRRSRGSGTPSRCRAGEGVSCGAGAQAAALGGLEG